MAARIAGSAARSNQTLQFQSAQADELSNQISDLGVVQGRLDISGMTGEAELEQRLSLK
jgi:hypothetical protein